MRATLFASLKSVEKFFTYITPNPVTIIKQWQYLAPSSLAPPPIGNVSPYELN